MISRPAKILRDLTANTSAACLKRVGMDRVSLRINGKTLLLPSKETTEQHQEMVFGHH
jgi:hypothetical protein